MKLHTLISSSLLVLTISTSTYANNFNYNYVELGYAAVTDFEINGGVIVSGSYDIQENINIIGDIFVSTGSDTDNVDVDLDSYRLGVGYHMPISGKTDVLAEVGLFNVSAKANSRGITINRDDSGYQLSAGVRHKLAEKIELQGRINYRNSDDLSDRNYQLGARYSFNPAISVGADFNTGAEDGSESLTTSIRWNFK